MKLRLSILVASISTAVIPPAVVSAQNDEDQIMPTPASQTPCGTGCLTPVEAVNFASQLGARAGVAGRFELTVRAVGEREGTIYLNSESDYRDRNCLTIALPKLLALRVFGSDAPEAIKQRLLGRKIVIAGVARQVRIDFIVDGQPTGKYYYQIHTRAMSARQFLVVPPPA